MNMAEYDKFMKSVEDKSTASQLESKEDEIVEILSVLAI